MIADATSPRLAATESERDGLAQLSGERIRTELLQLLAAPGVIAALRAMDGAGLIRPLIGVPGDIPTVARLAAIEEALGRTPDAVYFESLPLALAA